MTARVPEPLRRRIYDARRLAKTRAWASACLLFCCPGWAHAAPESAVWPAIRFSAEQLEYEDLRLAQVRAALSEDGALALSFGRLQGPGEPHLGNGLALEGALKELDLADDGLRLRCELRARGLAAQFNLESRGDDLRADLEARAQPLMALTNFEGLPSELDWVSAGVFDLGLTWRETSGQPAGVTMRLGLGELTFDSPDGRFAGAALRLALTGSAGGADFEQWRASGVIESGELLVGDFYHDFGASDLSLEATGRWTDTAVEIASLQMRDDAALSVRASAMLGLGPRAGEWSIRADRLELQFPMAYRRYLEPLAAAWTLDGLEVTGRLSWSGAWGSDGLQSGDLDIEDLSVVDTRRGRFALTGLETQLRPGDHAFDSRLDWRGLLIGKINLGAGAAELDSEPGAIALVEPLSLAVLGGELRVERLKVLLPGAAGAAGEEPDILLQASLEQVDMEQLTAAFGWPSFRGKVSGEIPGVSLDNGVLGVDGEIRVRVFDGLITLRNLSMERPFGVLPSLAADVEVNDLDLDLLTQTFSFGHISGRLDGYVRGLRMLDWEPVAFDAWLGTPVDQEGSKDISRQAVNNLTTIGGGPVTTALTNPLMRMFSNFSYRRLGLGCRLDDYVCELRGLSGNPDSVLIMEGSGIPKITIRAYNRRVDWPQMVANLLAVSGGDEIRIGRAPGT